MKTLKISLLALATIMFVSCEKKSDTVVTDADPSMTTTEGVATAENPNGTLVNASDAVFSIDQDTYDFGDVEAGSKTEKVITFKNTGTEPLVIQKAAASCGCTVPEYSKEPVAPGETGELTVSYQAPNVNGKQSKTVTLTTNTSNVNETFRITANVVGGQEKPAAPQPAPAQNLPAPNLGEVN